MSRFMTYIRFIKKLKQFHKNRNLENVLREDWSSCRELEEFCRDITSITEAGPEMRFQQKQAEYLALQKQIRSVAMDYWAELDSQMCYKKDAGKLEAVEKATRDYADVIAGVDQIADTTEALATFFRYTITDVERLVTLSDELENVEDYFTIQKFRFGDRMNLELELNDEELLSARMPRLVLQPLVENAVAHGLEEKTGEGIVKVVVESSRNVLYIYVKDDGVGMDTEQMEKLNEIFSAQNRTRKRFGDGRNRKGGIALPNVNSRIKLLFGEDYGLHVFSSEGMGTEIRMLLPLIYDDGEINLR